MVPNSEPNEPSRKTLDEIRREIDAEYAFPKVDDPAFDAGREESHDRADDTLAGRRIADDSTDRDEHAADARLAHLREFSERRRRLTARVDRRIAEEWTERPERERDEDAVDARLARFREISARRQVALGRHGEDVEGRGRRSGYLLAALIGCLVGQALLLVFLIVTNYGFWWQLPPVSSTAPARNDVAAPAPPPTPSRPATGESQVSPETRPQAEEPPTEPSSPPPAPPSPPASVDLPARAVPEPSTSSVRQPATISSATVRESDQPRVTAPSRPARPRSPASPRDVAESQAQVRAAFREWLRTSARGGAPVQTTEPVVVLGPDGRTAKTYVSVVSPIGLIPREQRWELGARGWDLIDDRQAGLPKPHSSR